MATPEQIRAALERLNPEQQQTLLAEYEKRKGLSPGLRLFMARSQGTQQATAGAQERSQGAIRDKGLDDPLSPEFQALREQGEMQGTAEAGPYAAGILGAGAAAGMAPAGLLPGLAKDAAIYGAAEVGEKALGLPSWTSEVIGAVSPGKQLLKWGLGKLGVGGAVKAAQTGAAQAAKAAAPEIDDAIKAAKLDSILQNNARQAANELRKKEAHELKMQLMRDRAAGKAGPKAVPRAAPPKAPATEGATALKPESEFIPDEAVSLVAEPLPFRPRGSVKPATNLGGPAKPGPAPTPDDKLAETLQASIDAAKAKKGAVRGKGTPLLEDALDTASGMHQREATAGMTERVAARRREVGADKLARELGMDADVIRSDAGDIVGEALGAHSPIIPEKAWKVITAKMLSLPPSERYAYVAKATGWARPQIEQLRRTYENLGIAIPVAAAGSLLASDQ
jgi:hypothetical protein